MSNPQHFCRVCLRGIQASSKAGCCQSRGGSVNPGDNKKRATTAAKCALVGATFTVTEDDYGDPLFVVNLGAATCLFHSLRHIEEWLAELTEVTSC